MANQELLLATALVYQFIYLITEYPVMSITAFLGLMVWSDTHVKIYNLIHRFTCIILAAVSLHAMFDVLFSGILARFIIRPLWDDGVARATFMNIPLETIAPNKSAQHPTLAVDRHQVNKFIHDFATKLGFELFSVSASKGDVSRGMAHSRVYYDSKDLQYTHHLDIPIVGKHVVKLVDVDYYDDVLIRVLRFGCPVVIYTHTPETAARDTKEHMNYFDETGYFVARYGMCEYKHQLWNFNDETIGIRSARGWNIYSLERRKTAPDRSLILFSPIAYFHGLIPWVLSMYHSPPLRAKTLSRFNPVEQGMVSFWVKGTAERYLTIGMVHSTISIELSAEQDLYLKAWIGASKRDIASVAAQLTRWGKSEELAPLIMAYYPMGINPPSVTLTDIVTYSWTAPKHCDVLKPSVRPIVGCPPLGPSIPCSPAQNKDNLKAAFEERTVAVRNTASPPSPFVLSCMDEFNKFLIPKPHVVIPVQYADALLRQRPIKREAFSKAMDGLPPVLGLFKIKSFLKRECYDEIKAPREIRDFPSTERPEQAAIFYAAETPIKNAPWYLFGLTPKDLERRVTNWLSKQRKIQENDFSKFDGTHGFPSRELEERYLLRLFHPSYAARALKLHKSTHFRRCGNNDTHYERLSGGFDTSIFNTLVAAFVDYLALRRSGFDSHKAYSMIGLHGGDDSLTADIPTEHVQWAVNQFGLKIKTMVREGSTPVTLLGRVYGPSTWAGSPSSVIDLPRLMNKFHVTTQSPLVEASVTLKQKALSLLATDAGHPIIHKFTNIISPGITSDLSALDPESGDLSWTLKTMLASGNISTFTSGDTSWYEGFMSTSANPGWYDRFRDAVETSSTLEEMAGKLGRPKQNDTSTVFVNDSLPPRQIVTPGSTPTPRKPTTNQTSKHAIKEGFIPKPPKAQGPPNRGERAPLETKPRRPPSKPSRPEIPIRAPGITPAQS